MDHSPEVNLGELLEPRLPYSGDVLELGLTAHFHRPVEIVDIEARAIGASSHPILRLVVRLGSGEELSVISKQLNPGERLYGNEREVLVYRAMLLGGHFGAPALYASVYDEPRERYELFLEDLGDSTLNQHGEKSWIAAARLLAEMHAAYLGREGELRALGCLAEHDEAYYLMVADAARHNLELANQQTALVRFDRLMTRFDSVVGFLVSQPRTFIHGDIFEQNVIVQADQRIRLVDWESAAIGLGVWDLIRLLDDWGPEQETLIRAYLKELELRSGATIDRDAFEQTFAHCKILNVLWHLRWSVEKCRDTGYVERELDKLERLWNGGLRNELPLRAGGAGRDG